ncbi:uncharacterized protein [Nicotiana sylvestris]|uniref:uncharacterized protein n=1 Tax=Nicotiana sylvestris TaxID=4096 RepID=UPI00388CDCFE
MLGVPMLGKPLILYIAAQERSLGALLSQENEDGKEQALRLARWSILFNQYEVTYTPQKAVKGQALANFLADHPLLTEWELLDKFPDEGILFIEEFPPWTMFFDGFARRNGAGTGVVLISPERQVLPFSFVLIETFSNNVTEYQALIVDLKMALEMKIL